MLLALVAGLGIAAALVTRQAARLAADRLSAASGLEVTIADLDLSLWPFGIAADDVAVRFPGAPEPSLTAERLVLVVDARTLPQRLWAGRPHVRRARLVAPRLHLERARDGRLVLFGAPAAPTAEERVPGPPAPPAPIALVVDRLDVARGTLVVDDATRTPLRTTTLGIDTLGIRGLAVRGDGGLADAAFEGTLSLEAARAAVAGRYYARGEGVRLRLRADLSRLALADAAPYVGPDLLHGGTVSGRVDYRWRPASRTPELRLEGEVLVENLDAGDGRTVPRTTIRTLRARDTDIDLGAQRVRVAEMSAAGATMRLPSATAAPPKPATAKAASGPAWDFAVARLVVRDATVQPTPESGLPDVAVRALVGRELASGWTSGGLTADATLATGGRVRARIVLDPRDAWTWMRVKADAIPLPALARGVLPASLRVDDGTLRAQATVLTPPLRISAARVTVDELNLVAPRAGGSDPVLALEEARLRVWSLALDPLDASLGPLELSWPYLVVRRDPQGVYPLHLAGGPRRGAPASGTAAGRVMLQSLAVRDGTIFFEDRVVPGGFFGSASALTATVYGLYGLPVRIGDATMRGSLNEVAPIEGHGFLSETSALRARVTDLPLAPLNPYVAPATGWAADGGTADLRADAALRDDTLDATATVVLVHPDLRRAADADVMGGLVGVPLTTALRLMQDARGRVELEFPVKGALDAPGVELDGLIVGAIGRAIAGAITSPLTLLGSAFARGEAPEELVLGPVLFPPGDATIDAAAERRLDLLAVLLGQKPDLVLDLTGSSGPSDAAVLGHDAAPNALTTLARARADAVAQRLVDRYRIAAERIRVAAEVRTAGEAGVVLTPAQ